MTDIRPPVEKWRQRRRYAILGTSFEAGRHFLATWQAWRDDAARPQQLHYLALLPAPLSGAELIREQAAWPQWSALSSALRAVWPPSMPGFHRLYLEQD